MGAIHIRRSIAHYHLTSAQLDQQSRLHRLHDLVLREALESALAQHGVADHELVCIRHIRVPVKLRLSAGDNTWIADWSSRLAEAIKERLDHQESGQGGTSDWLRFRTPVQGLVAMAVALLDQDDSQNWAWRQLGWWDGQHTFASTGWTQWTQAMVREPGAILPTLKQLAQTGRFSQMFEKLPESGWQELAAAVCQDADTLPATSSDGIELSPQHQQQVTSILQKVRTSSSIAAACGSLRGRTAVTIRSVAALALLEVEPSLPFAQWLPWNVAVTACAQELSGRASEQALNNAPESHWGPEEERAGDQLDEPNASSPDTAATESSGAQSLDGRRHHMESHRSESRSTSGHEVGRDKLPKKSMALRPKRLSPQRSSTGDRPAEPSSISPAKTEWGGLPFLLHIFSELNFAAEFLSQDSSFSPERSLRWVMHQFGMLFCGDLPDDPSVLALAGLAPQDTAPSIGQPPATDTELAALADWQARMVTALRSRLNWQVTDRELLVRLCQRRARIIADPGWIDVHLLQQEVCTDVRRAGLDLNLGHVPWLGVVVRFVYE